jgi:hypothetical protein
VEQGGGGFDPKGSAVNLVPDLTMSGKQVKQQRAVKMAVTNKRLGLHFGAGSGKSLISIGAFTEAHAQGKAKRPSMPCPLPSSRSSAGKCSGSRPPANTSGWPTRPRAGRIGSPLTADGGTHMVVVTHQAFRDDLMHALAEHRGEGGKEATGGSRRSRRRCGTRKIMKAATEAHGWQTIFWRSMRPTASLNRAGKAG